jgi:S-adenosylmethionine decarboxylase
VANPRLLGRKSEIRGGPEEEMSETRMVGFGPHLLYQAHGCPGARLEDLHGLYDLLDQMPERIHMTKIMPPYVLRHTDAKGRLVGCSGFVLIAQSHISLHTFPARGMVHADVFSCEAFDVGRALRLLRTAFHPQRVDWHLLDRGTEFPRDIAGSRALVERERRRLATTLGLEAMR